MSKNSYKQLLKSLKMLKKRGVGVVGWMNLCYQYGVVLLMMYVILLTCKAFCLSLNFVEKQQTARGYWLFHFFL